MALSTPASSRTSRLLVALRKPAAFFASNWAALVALATIVGVGPGLAGVMRVVTDLDRYEDEPFMTPLRQLRATWRRDLPVSLLLVIVLVLGALNTYAVTRVEVGVRVAVVGFLVPVAWAVCIFVAAYVAAASAQPLNASRHDVLGLTALLLTRRPVRSLLTPLFLIALAPVVLLPPLTVAVGLSLPAWFMGEWFGVTAWRCQLDPDPEGPPRPTRVRR
ncbi:MAG: hypothetical protein ACYC1E_02865 [Propionibacteriaceae bacterium]